MQNWFPSRPLSLLTALVAIILIIFPLYQRAQGTVYIEPLNYIDGTTLMMIGVLLGRGITSGRDNTDLQAVSMALVAALSFVFGFEALFKLSFYLVSWWMPPPELREFVIQTAITLTASAGFAFGRFTFSRRSQLCLALFVLCWVVWLAVGFPQLPDGGRNFYPASVNIQLSWDQTYYLNRLAKLAWCGLYFFLFNHGRVGGR